MVIGDIFNGPNLLFNANAKVEILNFNTEERIIGLLSENIDDCLVIELIDESFGLEPLLVITPGQIKFDEKKQEIVAYTYDESKSKWSNKFIIRPILD